MNEIQSLLLEELYFITSFKTLEENFNWDQNFKKEFIILLKQGWVYQYEYNSSSGDYDKVSELNLTDYKDYHYLASKKGLLAHSGL